MEILKVFLHFIWLMFLHNVVLSAKVKQHVYIDENWFPVNIIHLNDMHARFEETSVDSGICKEGLKCVGGYGRVVTKVNELLTKNKESNPIYLNAGDNFQGTLWYNIHRWNVTQYFLNLLPADAITIGNHEFDHGVGGCVPFMENLKSPIVITNVDDSLEPTFQNKYTNSTIIEKYKRKIGVIGVILATTDQIANTEKLKFTDESEAVKEEAQRLKDQGVNIIIVLSHCGLDVDRIIAKNAGENIDIIVGGHSHTFLFAGPNPPGTDKPADTYPVIETQSSGHKVLIVQASAYTKYLGDITLYFDDKGIVQHFEGAPIYLDSDIIPDPKIMEELKPWKEAVDADGNRDIGVSKVDFVKSGCYNRECSMGNLIADAYVDSAVQSANGEDGWTTATIAFVNPGSVRSNLNRGGISFADLVTTTPFGNTVDSLELQGKHIREALESSVTITPQSTMQVSGIKVTYNMTKPENQKIVELKVLCRLCDIPKYEDIKDDEWYRLVMPSFLSGGGDSFTMISKNLRNLKPGIIDVDALTNYIANSKTLTITGPKNRITILT